MFRVSESGNTDNSIEVPVLQRPATLKKFLVNFRRPDDYQGKYGFDWLRDEYVYPIKTVSNNNNGTPLGTPIALCKNTAALKTEYGVTDVKNPISPYGKQYYPAWLSIFPHTTTAQFAHGSRMHKTGVDLDIEIEEIEALVDDNTEILFESGNSVLKIEPSKLKLKDLIGSKKTKNLGGAVNRNYFLAKKKVNIKCTEGTLTSHEEIKVFAKLGSQKEEVGKLMVYKNNVIPKAEIVAINVITGSGSASLRNDYQYLFKNQSFNQALIRAEVKVDTKFDINRLPATDTDVINFKANYINTTSNIGTSNSSSFKADLIALYEKFGKHAPSGGLGIDTNSNKRTYLFYTTIRAETSGSRVQGSCSAKFNTNTAGVVTSITWGNAYVVYSTALNAKRTVLHECAHSFSLTHVFQETSPRITVQSPHIFYKGFTDNIMDYVNQVGKFNFYLLKMKTIIVILSLLINMSCNFQKEKSKNSIDRQIEFLEFKQNPADEYFFTRKYRLTNRALFCYNKGVMEELNREQYILAKVLIDSFPKQIEDKKSIGHTTVAVDIPDWTVDVHYRNKNVVYLASGGLPDNMKDYSDLVWKIVAQLDEIK